MDTDKYSFEKDLVPDVELSATSADADRAGTITLPAGMQAGEKLDAMLIDTLKETVSYGKVSIKDDNLVFEFDKLALNIAYVMKVLRDVVSILVTIILLLFIFTIIINPSNFDYQAFKVIFKTGSNGFIVLSFALLGLWSLFIYFRFQRLSNKYSNYTICTRNNINVFDIKNKEYIVILDEHTDKIYARRKAQEVYFNLCNFSAGWIIRSWVALYLNASLIYFLIFTNKSFKAIEERGLVIKQFESMLIVLIILIFIVFTFLLPWIFGSQNNVVKKFYKYI